MFLLRTDVCFRRAVYATNHTPTGNFPLLRRWSGRVPVVDEGDLVWPVSEVGAKVDGRVPATWANTLNPGRRAFGFRRVEVVAPGARASGFGLKYLAAGKAVFSASFGMT